MAVPQSSRRRINWLYRIKVSHNRQESAAHLPPIGLDKQLERVIHKGLLPAVESQGGLSDGCPSEFNEARSTIDTIKLVTRLAVNTI